MGDQNEVTNCLIFNNTIGAIDLRAIQGPFKGPQAVKDFPATQVAVRNNTLAFNWDHDKAAMGCGILLTGHEGRAVIENNVLAFLTGVTRAALHGQGRITSRRPILNTPAAPAADSPVRSHSSPGNTAPPRPGTPAPASGSWR